MTLVLSVATPAYGLQVSDRLVSKGGSPWDPLANKTVVFRATDGLVAFGYTGLAYMERNEPTDTWIAELVSGTSLGDGGTLRFGGFPVRDVGATLRSLRDRVDAREFERHRCEITAVGWQWDGKRDFAPVRSVLWVLASRKTTLEWEQLIPRHPDRGQAPVTLRATGNWPHEHDAGQKLLERILAAGSDWELVLGLLVDAIRSASALSPGTIGPHCMAALLRPWQFPNALVRFIPQMAHQAKWGEETIEVAYTPWMVAPDAIHAPALSVGGLTSEQGLLNYSIEVPAAPDSQQLKGAFTTQPRPRA
jgi:hypothetical protein